ncbi:MAG: hypothetical protein K8S27_12060 [Candidatus Omnitrophica bacterium]|nr:hypothetical protein [Candidatus Omnitrophota bacterium]
MIQFLKEKINKSYQNFFYGWGNSQCLFWALTCVSFLVYLPVFITPFAYHNDAALLSVKSFEWLGFFESVHILMVGRALGAVCVSVLAWGMNSLNALAWGRFACFFFIYIAMTVFIRFMIKRRFLDPFWAVLAGFSLIFSAPQQINVIWVANFFCGPFNAVFAFLCYFLWERGRGLKWLWERRSLSEYAWIVLSFIFFQCSLLIYPLTALFVFVLTVINILSFKSSQRQDQRKVFINDVIFFSAGMVIYRIIDRQCIYPIASQHLEYSAPAGSVYSMGLVKDIWSKWGLVKEIVLLSISHIWYLLRPSFGVVLRLIIVFTPLVCLFNRAARLDKNETTSWFFVLEKFVMFLILSLLIISPMIIAQQCFSVLGFRVLWPTTALGVVLHFWLWNKLDQNKRDCLSGLKVYGVALVVLYSVVTMRHMTAVAQNYYLEWRYLKSQMTAGIPAEMKRVVVKGIPVGTALVRKAFPFEFGYMLTSVNHVRPLFAVIMESKSEFSQDISFIEPGDAIYYDKFTKVIDLNDVRYSFTPSAVQDGRVYLEAGGSDAQSLITVHREGLDAAPFLVFEQQHRTQPEKKFPFWYIRGEQEFRIESKHLAQDLYGYRLIGSGFNRDGQRVPFQWTLQGRYQDREWKNLDVKREISHHKNGFDRLYPLLHPVAYHEYRFIIRAARPNAIVKIMAVQLIREKQGVQSH